VPLILSREQVRELLDMAVAIEAVEKGLIEFSAGQAVMPVRVTTQVPAHAGFALAMPAYLGQTDALGTKIVTVYKNNPQRGLPTILAVVVISDPQTGRVEAIMDGGYLTAVRTAAASAVGTRHLANRDARVLGILGAGVQGESHLWAMTEVLPGLERVVVHSRTRERAEAFAREQGARFGRPIAVLDSAEAVCRQSDVLVLATTATQPIVRRAWLKPGLHINAVGSHAPSTRELDSDTVAEARVVVDSREANLAECGDLLIPMNEGRIGRGHFADEIGEVAAGRKPGRASAEQITLFKSVGIAVEDVATGDLVYRRALEQGVGTRVEL
jgi:ornithine cyclodeaminase/alanine dehydrogenase